ncbi:MAG: hypothetical protein HUU41_15305 [Bryobacteraceae bacterium]|nr:hypothetical protein [Bryobacterales bacterium]MEB2362806.1 hypothetical protein [Bryobacterales bacterium]NUN02479.1 hypothetical protein [Bryobacteraceae bacterium]
MEFVPDASVTEALNDARATARDQLAAAWQLQLERVQEQLAFGWKEHLDHVFEERFAELSSRVSESFRLEVAAEVEKAVGTARRDVSDRLNESVRRMRKAANHEEWTAAFLESSTAFSRRIALFSVLGGNLQLEGARGMAETLPGDVQRMSIPLGSAPAFANAAESADTVAAMRSAVEISKTLSDIVGEDETERAYLFPIVNRQKVVAILYAEPQVNTGSVSALELLSTIAGLSLENRTTEAGKVPGLVGIITAPATPVQVAGWSDLAPEDQALHLRAQRFARVKVAEIRLHRAEAVRAGRKERQLYSAVKQAVDSARETFGREFVSASPTMVDYLHMELVRTLANDEISVLGPDYPGPMV